MTSPTEPELDGLSIEAREVYRGWRSLGRSPREAVDEVIRAGLVAPERVRRTEDRDDN